MQCSNQYEISFYETNTFVSGPTPYVAGYGNRPNDIEAYQKVGIPRYERKVRAIF